jgi:S1-C subfamily serine protease
VRATGCSTALRLAAVIGVLASLLGARAAHGALPETVERIKSSIVAVGTFQKTRSPPFVFRGTGFAVADGTLIATAAHALPETLQTEPPELMVVLVAVPGAREPQPREAKPIAVDRVHDVALMRIGGAPLPVVTFGDSDAVRDGTAIAFTGFPLSNALGFYPVTHRGIVSSRAPVALPSPTARQLDSRVIRGVNAGPFVLFQLDATAYGGHSGSPLYTADTGEVIGLVNMKLKVTKDAAVGQATGISFAVPIQHLQELIRSVR